jgi:hypothetical protein
MAIYVRQTGDMRQVETPSKVPYALLEKLRDITLARAGLVDGSEVETVNAIFQRRINEWERWSPSLWNSWGAEEDPPLLRWPGKYAPPDFVTRSWVTPSSMRNVDAECQVEISSRFLDSPASASGGKVRTDE